MSKAHSIYDILYSGVRSIFLMAVLCTGMANTLHADPIFNYRGNSEALSESQQHFLTMAMQSDLHRSYSLATVNESNFNSDVLTINLPNGLIYEFIKDLSRDASYGKRNLWIGTGDDGSWKVHFVWHERSVTGHIAIDDIAYVIRDLSEGLVAVIEVDLFADDGCLTSNEVDKEEIRDERPLNTDHPDLQNTNEKNGIPPALFGTGECKVRVLVTYTSSADAAFTDMLSEIINQVAIANTGYINSGTGFQIELAACYMNNYTESGSSSTDLSRFRINGDGFLDDVHTERSLWSADQCVLIINGGGGIAYLSNATTSQFSVTGINNFGVYTFHHELGHNSLCTHSLTQASSPGTAPYSGWGEPTTGCYRTIMAYSDACGTGGCPRQNIFSDDNGTWSCNSTNYPKGDTNSRNTDRLVLSRPILVSHYTVGISSQYSDNYIWMDKESVHFAADQEVGYSSSTNSFEFQSGSEGSFRASSGVTLGEGFHAKAGSDFRAYIDDCTPLREAWNNSGNAEVKGLTSITWEVFPVPSENFFTVRIRGDISSDAVILLSDLTGREVKKVITAVQERSAVTLSIPFDHTGISAGTYICTLQLKDSAESRLVILK